MNPVCGDTCLFVPSLSSSKCLKESPSFPSWFHSVGFVVLNISAKVFFIYFKKKIKNKRKWVYSWCRENEKQGYGDFSVQRISLFFFWELNTCPVVYDNSCVLNVIQLDFSTVVPNFFATSYGEPFWVDDSY